MFFRHKNQDDSYRRLEEQISVLTQAADAAKQKLEILNEINWSFQQHNDSTAQMISQLESSIGQHLCQMQDSMNLSLSQTNQNLVQLENHFHQLHADVHKHDMALEDLLDEWAEKKSDEEDVNARLKESSQTEKLLLDLFEAYQEQFWNMKHYASSKDEAWTAQIDLMEKNLERYRRSCSISLIQECGVSVNYDLHDVIEAIDTKDPALDKTIAEIYRCGYLYKGKIIKKAQAAAYRLTNAAP